MDSDLEGKKISNPVRPSFTEGLFDEWEMKMASGQALIAGAVIPSQLRNRVIPKRRCLNHLKCHCLELLINGFHLSLMKEKRNPSKHYLTDTHAFIKE
ncbi:hypothetical protein CDAR_42391 [Caerostris darwini]|uniref:Uncharacterized protein n=1 Tax=Caerostris darwini TaxID=1538125 RepID=A0AAV4RFJ8_9ARAC|nr:hypothetical protein CDAR_42391 [Caerostris darwini]